MTGRIPFIEAAAVQRLLGPGAAVEALRRTLREGFRPEDDHARIAALLEHGEFLLMPSEAGPDVGVKVLTVAPANPERGLARIQGLYLLMDADTLTPRCLVDGPALTDLRTAAVSLAATQDVLLRDDTPLDVALYGAGHQGSAHLRTLQEVLRGHRRIGSVTAIVRRPERVERIDGVTAVTGAGTEQAAAATAGAGLIVCTTTARSPLFDSAPVRDDAVVIAVGSHEPDARELDAALLGRSDVVVEDAATALRECGDVVMAVAEGALDRERLIPVADLLTGAAAPRGGRPVVFKSSGMPWEDLVVAAAVARAYDEHEHSGLRELP